jgi:argininosuccinate synthase
MLLGAKTFTCLDVVKEYYDSCIQYLVFGNVLKNNTYPLSVSAERTIQAKSLAEYALKLATAIAHGSTGAGNDQVRFDGIFNIVCPQMEIITPIRDLKLSREAEIQYLNRQVFREIIPNQYILLIKDFGELRLVEKKRLLLIAICQKKLILLN